MRPGRVAQPVIMKPKPGATVKNLSMVAQIGKSKLLNQSVEDENEDKNEDKDEDDNRTSLKITLWKVDINEPPVILGEQRIEIQNKVNVLRNKMLFSQDGKYIYLIFVDNKRYLWRAIALDSFGLNHVMDLDLDLSKIPERINGKPADIIDLQRTM